MTIINKRERFSILHEQTKDILRSPGKGKLSLFGRDFPLSGYYLTVRHRPPKVVTTNLNTQKRPTDKSLSAFTDYCLLITDYCLLITALPTALFGGMVICTRHPLLESKITTSPPSARANVRAMVSPTPNPSFSCNSGLLI